MKLTPTTTITAVSLVLFLGACSDESKKELKEAGKETKEAVVAVGKDIKHGAAVATEKTVAAYNEVKQGASAAAHTVAKKSGEYYEVAKKKTGEIYEKAKKEAGDFIQDDQYEAPQKAPVQHRHPS